MAAGVASSSLLAGGPRASSFAGPGGSVAGASGLAARSRVSPPEVAGSASPVRQRPPSCRFHQRLSGGWGDLRDMVALGYGLPTRPRSYRVVRTISRNRSQGVVGQVSVVAWPNERMTRATFVAASLSGASKMSR